ncbi:MAG TPA: helix-turn-helix domain-containing protein [Bacilli bacterium]|nr:helix-turn-helix domain-containing protein [Bacilli bacterium]HPN60706.1 helix-turn-helix domain-containing protein [Bacilli bacterium]HPX84405.1 helix-turn-helix domain-containing protein [Bacilli bacterium]HQC74790.1 helix-turn-helix domain-containing protein [Bacilli bacterium]
MENAKIYDYLFRKQAYPFSNRPYYFLVIKMVDPSQEQEVVNFLEELWPKTYFLKLKQELIVFYFEEYDFKNVMVSMSDDFSWSFSCFQSGKMNPDYPEYFHILLDTLHLQFQNRSYFYLDIVDLIMHLVKTNRSLLRPLVPIILNRVYKDSQYERIIKAMFEHDLNVTKAAQSVYMHRNTMINKLEFIKTETGLNIQHFKPAFCMYWLLDAQK